jgi:hypothetical protein
MEEKLNWWWYFFVAGFLLPLLQYALTRSFVHFVSLPFLKKYLITGLNPSLTLPISVLILLLFVLLLKIYARFIKAETLYRFIYCGSVLVFMIFLLINMMDIYPGISSELPSRRYYDMSTDKNAGEGYLTAAFMVLNCLLFLVFFLKNLSRKKLVKNV